MTDIKLLDCTLRDGGYINDWNFGLDNSKNIISCLIEANLDFIELGFLTNNEKTNKDKTLFNSLDDIRNITSKDIPKEKLITMITCGKFPIENIPNIKSSPIENLRLIFKKNQTSDAIEYAKKLKLKGYRLFINPTFITEYNNIELIELINKINEIKPYAMTIVDSMGILDEDTLEDLFIEIDKTLNSDITLCFHSHNNLGLSLANTKKFIKLSKKRKTIIDSSILGMARGAGNPQTETLADFLNKNYSKNYNIEKLVKISRDYIEKYYKKTPWGFSVPYFLSATNKCHPNYAKFMIDNSINSAEVIDRSLKKLKEDKKAIYCEDEIRKIVFSN